MRYLIEVFVLQLKCSTIYRANWLFSAAAEFIPLAGLLMYLSGVFPAADAVHGYSKPELITYYVITFALSGWIPTVWYEVGNNIRTGQVSSYLLKPVSYFWHYAVRQFAVSLSYVLFCAGFVIALVLSFPGNFLLPGSPSQAVLFLVSAGMAFQLAYQVGYLIHLSAFWVDDLTGILSVVYLLQTVLSGQLFPIDFLPGPIARVVAWMPFPYIFYLPAKVYLGAPGSETLAGLATAAAWLLLTGLAIRGAWSAGLRIYHARGG